MLLQVKFAKITHEQRHPTDQYNEYLKEIAGILGIDKRVTSHLARHTFATTVTYANGVSIEAISKMLGHTKLSTTQIYARIVDQTISKTEASAPPQNRLVCDRIYSRICD